MALVGIGSLPPSELLRRAATPSTMRISRSCSPQVRSATCATDSSTQTASSCASESTTGSSASTREVCADPTPVGVAGGQRQRTPPSSAAIKGGWVNVIVTDLATARELLAA